MKAFSSEGLTDTGSLFFDPRLSRLATDRTTSLFAEDIKTHDAELRSANVEYESKRDLGRLAPVRLALVAPGLFDRVRRDGSAHDAQYKETHLASDPACQTDLEIIERVS